MFSFANFRLRIATAQNKLHKYLEASEHSWYLKDPLVTVFAPGPSTMPLWLPYWICRAPLTTTSGHFLFQRCQNWNLDPQQVVSSFWEKSVTCLQPLSTLQNSILIDNQHSLTLWSFCPSNGTLSQPPSGPKSEQKKVVRSRQES